jgi:cellulose synthase/poly-beta-1,6-N-acetylglucosamine synthase-like glycosyltransferase
MVVMVTKDYLMPKCMKAVLAQDYDNYSTLIHVMKPTETHKNPNMAYIMNIAKSKEVARKLALASDAKYFLFVDSDVVIPSNAISELVKQLATGEPSKELALAVERITGKKSRYIPKHAIAGYYPSKEDKNLWIMGRYVADNTVFHLRKVEPSVTRVDFAGCGCMRVDRFLLKKLKWRSGIDRFIKTVDGTPLFLDDSLDLCSQIYELGYDIWADGSVVCQHLKQSKK